MDVRKLSEFSARVGIAYISGEIYGGFSGFYDWGVRGSQLKKSVKDEWWRHFVEENELVVGIDGSIVTHPRVWEASGHTEHFHDPVTRCKSCGRVYRADHLVEEVTGSNVEGMGLEELRRIVSKIRCPVCGGELEDVSLYSLMMETRVGPYSGTLSYLRPETAQLIFIAFPRVYHHARRRMPLGVAQMGKAYRNEISPRGFLFRLREFEQMEIEFFFDPEEKGPEAKGIEVRSLKAGEKGEGEVRLVDEVVGEYPGREWMVYWIEESLLFLERVGVDMTRVRIRQQSPEERAHYSMDTWDVEFCFDDMGWKEIEGIAHRSDYDLKRHAEFSGKKLEAVRPDGTKFVPWVIEPSWGVERLIMAILYSSYREEEGRVYLSLKPAVAPVQVAVLPLVTKDGLPEKAREVYNVLKKYFRVEYDEKGSIGKRYRRYDEIGTPFCVTIDYETLENDTVTVRQRDNMKQVRVRIPDLREELERWMG